jgi:HK97 gp10 family phage protein
MTSTFRWINKNELVKAVDGELEQVAATVNGIAKQWCPVDTGTLRGSIAYHRERADASEVRWLVGTGIFYAPFVEFGTRYQPAQPYLGKALEWARARYG